MLLEYFQIHPFHPLHLFRLQAQCFGSHRTGIQIHRRDFPVHDPLSGKFLIRLAPPEGEKFQVFRTGRNPQFLPKLPQRRLLIIVARIHMAGGGNVKAAGIYVFFAASQLQQHLPALPLPAGNPGMGRGVPVAVPVHTAPLLHLPGFISFFIQHLKQLQGLSIQNGSAQQVSLIHQLQGEKGIVFIQQLGRGLRKREDKEFLVAIDFIGNYKKSFLIPIALSGDNTYDKDNLRKYITEGSSAIPGCSTIDFDPIARGLIYRNIDSSDLKQLSILKNEYFTLKNRLGRIPTIADFRREKAMDIQNFVDKAGSYHAFVKKVDDDYDVSLTENEEKVLRYVSEKFSDGKRADELLYLKEALSFYNTHENGIFKKEKEAGQRFSSMIANLTLSFPQPTEALKYGKTPLLEIGSDLITPSERLSGCLLNPVFRTLLEDVVNDGLERNREKYGRTYKDTLFTLYDKYTYEDVCRLLLWERNMNANGIGGYFYDKKTKTLPVFINYEKADRAIQYPNTFPDNSNITAYSKMPRRIGSSDYNHIYKTTEEDKDNRIYLFLRKNSKDDRKEFYFLGEIEAIGEAKEVKINGKNAFEIHYHINTPVRQDIFDYITS